MRVDLTLPAERAPATLASSAYERLRREIISGALEPGAKLHIARLCERYGMGLSPVREALNRLSTEGFVLQADQRGFRVAQVSDEDLEDTTRARCWLNEIGLRQSMALGGSAWEEAVLIAVHRLSRIKRYAGKASDCKVDPAWESAHRTFHMTLVSGCGSPSIIAYCEQLFERAQRYRHLSRAIGDRARPVCDEHKRIVDAILARDADRATRLLTEHFSKTAALVRKHGSWRALSRERKPRSMAKAAAQRR